MDNRTVMVVLAGALASSLDRTSVCEGDDLMERLHRPQDLTIRCVREEPMDWPAIVLDRQRHSHPITARDLRRAERGRSRR